ncbi:hypothetical protein [Paraburkholderia elongata]|uniref:Transposase n=1 Tax=Paraburkholderia elongata TaxID=2675747 RepID=A0A972NYY1_9BURK|nr:hypothetical protein [Paraburkholderia elongata]NPT60317.1 hypothetical protein [Paraburkholderia elongata]
MQLTDFHARIEHRIVRRLPPKTRSFSADSRPTIALPDVTGRTIAAMSARFPIPSVSFHCRLKKKRPPGGDGAQTFRHVATDALTRGNLNNDAGVLAGAAAVQRLIRVAQTSRTAWTLNRHAHGRSDG